jgi:hypothetical protein
VIHVPADLFELARVGEPWPPRLAYARRLLVTMWVLHPDLRERAAEDLPARARAVWDVHVNGLARHGRVSVTTALVQLKDLGLVRAFDSVEGGFVVELVKEAA